MDIKEEESILSEFPNIKLSYETYVHKKVYNAHVILAIPDGIRHYAWFTTYNNNNVCWLLELSSSNKIVKVSYCITSFSDKLSYGTILYGTLFKYKQNSCFSVEDMFYYKGKNIQAHNYLQKLNLMKELFSLEMCMDALNKNFVMFGLPYMDGQFNNVLSSIETLPYKSSIIQFRYLEGKQTNQYFNMKYIKPRSQYFDKNNNKLTSGISTKQPIVFKVVPEIQNDIYKLYTCENDVYTFFDFAYIPTYTTSVMMNSLFRNIKENRNLDALEESDDESEFENTNLDKHVFLDKSFLMVCEYNGKFKKWSPVKVAEEGANVISVKYFTK